MCSGKCLSHKMCSVCIRTLNISKSFWPEAMLISLFLAPQTTHPQCSGLGEAACLEAERITGLYSPAVGQRNPASQAPGCPQGHTPRWALCTPPAPPLASQLSVRHSWKQGDFMSVNRVVTYTGLVTTAYSLIIWYLIMYLEKQKTKTFDKLLTKRQKE